VYDLGRPGPGDLPESPLTANVPVQYTVSEPMVRVAGDVLRRTGRRGLVLVGTDQPFHLLSRVTGIYRDRWSGERATYTRYRCRGGTVTGVFASDSNLFKRSQTVTAAGRHVTFAPSDATHPLRVPLHRSANGTCSVTFAVSPTAVPADVLPRSSDERVLGVRFTVFRYTAP
jgi:hypothetical protein